MNSRHRAREAALQILYRYDVSLESTGQQPPEGGTLAEELKGHFDHFQVPDALREFAGQLVAGTLLQRRDLDALIEQHASNWKISRMGLIDRNLLRMGAYELQRFQDIPASVTLDEAIELARQFGTSDSPGFVNGILDSIRRSLPARPTAS